MQYIVTIKKRRYTIECMWSNMLYSRKKCDYTIRYVLVDP